MYTKVSRYVVLLSIQLRPRTKCCLIQCSYSSSQLLHATTQSIALSTVIPQSGTRSTWKDFLKLGHTIFFEHAATRQCIPHVGEIFLGRLLQKKSLNFIAWRSSLIRDLAHKYRPHSGINLLWRVLICSEICIVKEHALTCEVDVYVFDEVTYLCLYWSSKIPYQMVKVKIYSADTHGNISIYPSKELWFLFPGICFSLT